MVETTVETTKIPLKVLGDRVLVKPDPISNAPETLESGIVVAKTLAAAVEGEDPSLSLQRGTVVAVGNPKHPLKEEAETLADKLEWRSFTEFASERDQVIVDAMAMLCDLVRRRPIVNVDDDVLFAHSSGQEITLQDETYIILHEDELLAVVEEH